VFYDIDLLLSLLRFANNESHQYSKFTAVSLENDTAFNEQHEMFEFALYDYFAKTRIMVKMLIESFEKKRETADHFWLMSETRCVCYCTHVEQDQSLRKVKQKR
jgi:hypothetical protein